MTSGNFLVITTYMSARKHFVYDGYSERIQLLLAFPSQPGTVVSSGQKTTEQIHQTLCSESGTCVLSSLLCTSRILCRTPHTRAMQCHEP